MNRDVDEFRLRVNGARADIAGLMLGYNTAKGEARDAYAIIIKDKLTRFHTLCWEFYAMTIEAVTALRTDLARGEPSSSSFVPPVNEPYEKHL